MPVVTKHIKGGVEYTLGAGTIIVQNDVQIQNGNFSLYPDFRCVLMDFDRSLDNPTGTLDIYGNAVDLLNLTTTKSGGGSGADCHLRVNNDSTELTYRVGSSFYFYGGETIGKNIITNFKGTHRGGGSGQYTQFKVTPGFKLVHRDGTTSQEVWFKQSDTVYDNAVTSYSDISDGLTAQAYDKLILMLKLTYVSGFGYACGLQTNNNNNPYGGWNPIQLSVE